MAIVNTDTKRKVSGDGVTREFSFPFKIYTKSDITVWLVDKDTDDITEMSLTTDYKVSINRVSEGGTIEFVTLLPPSADEWVFMFSNLEYTQTVVISTDGVLRERSITNGMDRIVRLIQQNREVLDRTIQIPRQAGEDVPDYSVLIDDAKEAAQNAADEAEGYVTDAEAAKTDAEAAKTDAEASAISAANAALALRGTSTTSLTIAPGEKIFTTQADKQFNVGHYLLAVDAADSSNYMFGSVTSYSGTTLTLDITATGGAGTISNWTIMVSGLRGAKGDPGTGSVESGTDATKSTSPSAEDIYFASDTEKLYWCLSAGVWTEIDLTNNVDILVPDPEAGDAGKALTVNANETGYELGYTVPSVDEKSANYTLAIDDFNKVIRMNSGSALTLTVPKHSAVAIPVGAIVAIHQEGVGQVTITPVDGDVTIQSVDSALVTTEQHAVCALVKLGENLWVATGSLEEVA